MLVILPFVALAALSATAATPAIAQAEGRCFDASGRSVTAVDVEPKMGAETMKSVSTRTVDSLVCHAAFGDVVLARWDLGRSRFSVLPEIRHEVRAGSRTASARSGPTGRVAEDA